jgi:hypothetical protein
MFLCCIADGNIGPQNFKNDLYNKFTWKLQEFVVIYYNDLAITLSRFAWYCTTYDQQIQTCLEKHERSAKKPENPSKGTLRQVLPLQTNKTISSKKPVP